jgi:hypothetical protein
MPSRRLHVPSELELVEAAYADLPIAAVVVDADSLVRGANRAARELFGSALEPEASLRSLAGSLMSEEGHVVDAASLPPALAM